MRESDVEAETTVEKSYTIGQPIAHHGVYRPKTALWGANKHH